MDNKNHKEKINKIEFTKFSLFLDLSRLVLGIITIIGVTILFYPKNELLWPWQVQSLTFKFVFFGIILIFIVIEIIRFFNQWHKHNKTDLLTIYYSGIITTMGFTIAAFFVLVSILWSRESYLQRLQDHTLIGLLFLSYFLINCYDIMNIIQKRILEIN